jgi:hypothetical protein
MGCGIIGADARPYWKAGWIHAHSASETMRKAADVVPDFVAHPDVDEAVSQFGTLVIGISQRAIAEFW